MHVERVATRRHLARLEPRQLGEPLVGEAHGFQRAEIGGVLGQAMRAHALLAIDDVLQLLDEPRVDLAGIVDLLVVDAEPERLRDFQQPVGGGGAERGTHHVLVVALAEPFEGDVVDPGQARLHRAQRLCSDSGKVRPMAMASPTDFIEVVSTGFAPGNFSKAKRGILVTT